MKILTGDIEPTKGSVTRPKRVGVLRQDQFAFDAHRVIDAVIMSNAVLWNALQQREELYAKDYSELTDEDGMRLGELEGIVGDEGGYTAESDAAVLLDGERSFTGRLFWDSGLDTRDKDERPVSLFMKDVHPRTVSLANDRRAAQPAASCRGFKLIELMLVVAVACVILADRRQPSIAPSPRCTLPCRPLRWRE